MIWCVEDDASIRDIEIYAPRAAGFEVRGFGRRQLLGRPFSSSGPTWWCWT